MIKHLLFFLTLVLITPCFSQDVGISSTSSVTSPQSGCEVGTATEIVNVLVQNYSPSFIPGNNITVNYSIDGGPIVSELLTTNLSGFATWNFAFSVTTDVSACDTFNIKSWTEYASDVNQVNDTLEWDFVNSCIIVPGTIAGASALCVDGNTGILNLINMQNGTVDDWMFSTNGGVSYSNTFTGTSDYTYTNLTTETDFIVALDGGFCPNDSTPPITMTIDPSVNAGFIPADQFFCASSSMGSLQVNGYVSTIIDWESSTDYGATWSSLATPGDVYNFASLSTDTYFRAIAESGACGTANSDTMKVFITPITYAGLLEEDNTVCQGINQDTIFVNGNVGSVTDWEYSDDGSTWFSLGITDSLYEYIDLPQQRFYRVIAKNGICPSDVSNIVTISMQPEPPASAGVGVSIPQGSSVTLNGSGGLVAVWSPGITLSDSMIFNPTATPDSTTTYTIFVMDSIGCMAQDEVTITLIDTSIYLLVANVITPNNDGFNDNWLITGLDKFSSVEVFVYNAYGKEIFYSENYANEWDATYNGVKVPDGAYPYAIKADDFSYKGIINILGND